MPSIPINSVLNVGLPALTPDQFDDSPEVKSAVELFINAFVNLQGLLEQYGGYTQKDITQWPTIHPIDTLLAHQVRRFYAIASVPIAFGDLVQVFNNAGVMNVRLANAAAGVTRRANGFCSTATGVGAGNRGEFILVEGLLPVAGVNPGDILYLSAAVAGKIVANVAPAAVGQLEQTVGFGLDFNYAYIHLPSGTYIQH